MFKKIFLVLSLALCSFNLFGADSDRYATVSINAYTTDGVHLTHKGTTEVGRKVQFSKTPSDTNLLSDGTRIDYQITQIDPPEHQSPHATIQGTFYKSDDEGRWTILSEFGINAQLGQAASVEIQQQSGGVVTVEIEINKLSKEEIKELFKDGIPAFKECATFDLENSLNASEGISLQNMRCCHAPCGEDGTVMTCCGVAGTTCCGEFGCGCKCTVQ